MLIGHCFLPIPAIFHAPEDLRRNILAHVPISRMNTNFVAELRVSRRLQTLEKLVLDIVFVFVRLRDERVIVLVFVNVILVEETP